MNFKPKFLVLYGDGVNCENESSLAIENAGGACEVIHINKLKNVDVSDFDGLFLPGGFSFGDELGSGKLLALKLRHTLFEKFDHFVQLKKPIIGVCNGFQVLIKMGVLPKRSYERNFTLTHNIDKQFVNKWVSMHVSEQINSPWFTGMNGKKISLPVRHGEGRLIAKEGAKLEKNHIALTYDENFNGSLESCAALVDETGLILGMMPHPEAAIFPQTAPLKNNRIDLTYNFGAQIFSNIVNYLTERHNLEMN